MKPFSSFRASWFYVSFLAFFLFFTGCSSDAELDTLEPQGPSAQAIDSLSNPIFIIAGIVLLLVVGGTIYMWRFRSDHSDEEFPTQIHGNLKLEILRTIIPGLILAGVAVFTLITLAEINSTEDNAMALSVKGETVSWEPEVVVVGQQWWWEYRYYMNGLEDVDLSDARNLPPADIVTSTQMVIPTGEEIELKILSRDVIHSHWIPALNGKKGRCSRESSPLEN